jgi:hypothetical protein
MPQAGGLLRREASAKTRPRVRLARRNFKGRQESVDTHGTMRRTLHTAVGVFSWALMLALWVVLVEEGNIPLVAFETTAWQLGAIAGAVFAVTSAWIWHNVRIYRRKGPRRASPTNLPRIDDDRLGRTLRWAIPGGIHSARGVSHLIVELDGDVKTYRRER